MVIPGGSGRSALRECLDAGSALLSEDILTPSDFIVVCLPACTAEPVTENGGFSWRPRCLGKSLSGSFFLPPVRPRPDSCASLPGRHEARTRHPRARC